MYTLGILIQKKLTMTHSRTLEDIYTYETQALQLLSTKHPHYEEVKQLLTDQINDEIRDYAHTRTD